MYMYFNSEKIGKTDAQKSVITNIIGTNVLSNAIQATVAAEELHFVISEFSGHQDNAPKAKSHTWDSFCKEFSKHAVQTTKQGPAWSPASYLNGTTRKNGNVDQISMAVIDVDNGTSLDVLLPRLKGFACLVHSSYSHTAEVPKYRVVIPFAKPVAAAEWPDIWTRLNQLVGGCNDPATKDPSRLYYKPAHAPEAEHHFAQFQEGSPISIADLPALATPMTTSPITFFPRSVRNSTAEVDGIETAASQLHFEQGLKVVEQRCAFMQFASAKENQQHLSEPLWMAMISNACRFEKSEQWIHESSRHHGEYDENETTSRIERYRIGSPPMTCQRIRELGFQNCPTGGCKRPNGEVTKAPAGLYGWMFRNQLGAAETISNQIPESYSVSGFSINDEGVFMSVNKKGEAKSQLKISSRIDVVALTRDQDSGNWGMQLRFCDPDNVMKSWALPRELLASSGDSYRSSLLKMGVSIEPSKEARDGLAGYLVAALPAARALSVRQPGWSNGSFVLPDAVYGRSSEPVVFQTNDTDELKRFSQKGSLESWQQNVAYPCIGNSRAIASICIGLAPPLLALLGEDNGGFHLRGNSSIGKSVCLFLGSSVWGGSGLIRTWNVTVNGLEGVAAMHNDVLLPLDELGQADGKAAGEAAYMLGNGQGKSRAGRGGEARSVKKFRNLVLSSGEKSISVLISEAGSTAMAGQEVRMVEIPADAGCNFGVFEDIHGARSSQIFAETLKHSAASHHGHAGRAFVEMLADQALQPRLIEKVKALMKRFVETYVPSNANGQVGRVGNRFALIAAAGELCIELGILPWPEGEAFAACQKCFMAWIDLRGGIENHESSQAIAKVRRFIELNGESRFTAWNEDIDNNGMGKTIQRAGFRRATSDGRTEYFVFPEAYKSDICAGMDARFVTKTLIENELLNVDNRGKPQIDIRLPGMGKMRVYHLTADIMGEAVSQLPKEETLGRQPQVSKLGAKYDL